MTYSRCDDEKSSNWPPAHEFRLFNLAYLHIVYKVLTFILPISIWNCIHFSGSNIFFCMYQPSSVTLFCIATFPLAKKKKTKMKMNKFIYPVSQLFNIINPFNTNVLTRNQNKTNIPIQSILFSYSLFNFIYHYVVFIYFRTSMSLSVLVLFTIYRYIHLLYYYNKYLIKVLFLHSTTQFCCFFDIRL